MSNKTTKKRIGNGHTHGCNPVPTQDDMSFKRKSSLGWRKVVHGTGSALLFSIVRTRSEFASSWTRRSA